MSRAYDAISMSWKAMENQHWFILPRHFRVVNLPPGRTSKNHGYKYMSSGRASVERWFRIPKVVGLPPAAAHTN